MTKKPEAAKPAQPSTSGPAETWNTHWNVSRRLLEARRVLRDTKLWKQFEMQRSFDAFSIHPLARGIEEVLTDLGVISSFSVTKWQKVGNTTVVEGVVQFESVDSGEIKEYPTVGEGIDDSDKGFGKSISYARKMGLIAALNLGIGVDNEEAETKPNAAPAAGPTMGGTPQQTSHQAAPATNGHAAPVSGGSAKLYTLQQVGVKARAVLGNALLTTCWNIVRNSPTITSLDSWIGMNNDMLLEFSVDDPVNGKKLEAIVSSQRETLAQKGAI